MATKKKEDEVKKTKATKVTKKEKEIKEEVKRVEEEKATPLAIAEFIAIIIAIIIIEVFFQGSVICNIVTLLLMLTVLITVHEWGHFIMSKKFGVHVYEFAIGMGPKILAFRRKNDPTLYTIRALPIGGYNQLAGEIDEDDEKLAKDKFLCNKPKYQRLLILCAGVFMNFVTAIVFLFIIAFGWGYTEQNSYVGEIEANSPAAEAGILAGDKIIEYNGKKVSTWDEITIIGALKKDVEYNTYKVQHEDGSEQEFKITPADYVVYENKYYRVTTDNTKEQIAEELNVSVDQLEDAKIIGISQSNKRYTGFVNALKYAFTKFWSLTKLLLLTLGYLFTGKLGLSALSGPVGMYKVVGEVAKFGIANVIYLTAYLSINLGVINILPFPAFDGGHVVFLAIEAITKKKVSPNVENIFHMIGFIIIFLLMIIVTGHDIWSLFTK